MMTQIKLLSLLMISTAAITLCLQQESQAARQGLFQKLKSGAEYRRSIREMDILDRPDRFGHFYGNTVRRMNERRNGR